MLTPDGVAHSRAGGDGERGQSEVIGVILLTAVAIVLAAVIGQYVFGINIIQSPQQSVGPQISFETEIQTDGDLVVRHASGDSVETTELTVVGSESGNFDVDWNAEGVDTEWTASESITVSPQDGETVRIVWESSTTDDSAVLLKYQYTS